MKSAMVLGATGLVGRTLVNMLLQDRRYNEVTCLVRKPLSSSMFNDPHNRLKPVVIDFDNLQDYQGYFSVNHVYCCLGTTLKKAGSKQAFRRVDFEYVHVAAQLTRAQRADSFVWISSVGAFTSKRRARKRDYANASVTPCLCRTPFVIVRQSRRVADARRYSAENGAHMAKHNERPVKEIPTRSCR